LLTIALKLQVNLNFYYFIQW